MQPKARRRLHGWWIQLRRPTPFLLLRGALSVRSSCGSVILQTPSLLHGTPRTAQQHDDMALLPVCSIEAFESVARRAVLVVRACRGCTRHHPWTRGRAVVARPWCCTRTANEYTICALGARMPSSSCSLHRRRRRARAVGRCWRRVGTPPSRANDHRC